MTLLTLAFPSGAAARVPPLERLRMIAAQLAAQIDHEMAALTPAQRANLRLAPLAILAAADEIEGVDAGNVEVPA